MAVEKQVVIIYAATKRYLLDIPVDQILDFEAGLFDYVDAQYPEVFNKIREEKKLTEEIETMLNEAITSYKAQR